MKISSKLLSTTEEPRLRVRILTDGAPILVPLGDYDIDSDSTRVYYRQLSEDSSIIVENLSIGKGFHWQTTISSRFSGDFEVSRSKAGHFESYNIIPIEKYIESVITSEMNLNASKEFLKAHAIISRGWALGKLLKVNRADNSGKINEPDKIIIWEDTGDHNDCDLCNDDHCQRYQGFTGDTPLYGKIKEIVDETRGMILVDQSGNLADTRFSKCCGGTTELFSNCWQDIDYNYLPVQSDPWCDLSKISDSERTKILASSFKDYDSNAVGQPWIATVDLDLLTKKILKLYNRNLGVITSIRPVKRSPSGRIIELDIIGENSHLIIGKELAIRRLLSDTCLRSSAFICNYAPQSNPKNRFISLRSVSSPGTAWGHGVGLCQTGAAVMASKGASAIDILNFYYPNTCLTKLYD